MGFVLVGNGKSAFFARETSPRFSNSASLNSNLPNFGTDKDIVHATSRHAKFGNRFNTVSFTKSGKI